MPKNIDMEEAKRVVNAYKDVVDLNVDQEGWFNGLKEFAATLGYTSDRKAFKKDPTALQGNGIRRCWYSKNCINSQNKHTRPFHYNDYIRKR